MSAHYVPYVKYDLLQLKFMDNFIAYLTLYISVSWDIFKKQSRLYVYILCFTCKISSLLFRFIEINRI